MKLSRVLATLIVCAITSNAFADLCFHAPYIAVDATQTNQDFRNGYGEGIFYKNPQYYGVFGGFKFVKNFGIEAGYEFQPSRDESYTIEPGTTFGSLAPTTGEFIVTQSSMKFKAPYVGLFGEYQFPGLKALRLQGLIGASISHLDANVSLLADESGPITPAVVRTYSKTKTVVMAKLTGAYNFTKHLGLGVSIKYVNLRSLEAYPEQPSNALIKLNDMFGVGLALYWWI